MWVDSSEYLIITMNLLCKVGEDEMISDELLFYSGTTVAVVALVMLVVLFLLFRLRKYKLNEQFDQEYGQDTRLEPDKHRKVNK